MPAIQQDLLHLAPHATVADDCDFHGARSYHDPQFKYGYFPRDCTRVTTEVFTTSSTEHPRDRSLTGLAKPWRNGP